MAKQIIIAEQHRVAAVFADDQIQELIVAKGTQQVSDIYLGSVENVLPSIDAAFVNIGDTEKNGFIHMGDLGPLKLRRNGGSITDLLRPHQKVLVQVMKEPTGNKGPRLTGNVSLPGRYLVLMPFGRGVNLSRRISSEAERSRLRALAVFIKPAGMGMLIRTEAEGVDEEAIIEDLELLMGQWENIQQEMETAQPPTLMNRDDDFIQRVLRDAYNTDANRIVVDSHTGLKRVKQYLSSWSGGQLPQGILIDHHSGPDSVLEHFRVNAAIRESLKPRVDLPSGGYIIIEPTEALVVVDVNSGSFTRSATSRETVLWTNFEAATELARQLRLRNLAGVIVVDFIDMDHRSDQLRVLEHFTKALKPDKSRPQIAQLSELGLVELTRKRQGQNIYELFGQPCPSCSGLGHLVLLPGQTAISEEEVEGREAMPGQRLSIERAAPRSRRGSRSESRSNGRSPRELRPSLDTGAAAPTMREAREEPEETLESSSYLPDRNRRRRRRGGEAIERSSSIESETREPREGREPRESREPRDGNPIEPRGRRERSSNRQLEPVVVEMTTDEQDVYAWLGVSPLILKDSELDPQAAMITVTLPGEAPPEEIVSAPVSSEVEEDDAPREQLIYSSEGNSDEDSETEGRQRRVLSRRRRPRSKVVETPILDTPSEADSSELEASPESSEEPEDSKPRRGSSRRPRSRRKSSISRAEEGTSANEASTESETPILDASSTEAPPSEAPVRRRRRRSSAKKSDD